MMQLFDYVSSELVHNKTYAHRLPPTYIEQARGFADWRENAIFGDSQMNGVGNSESRPSFRRLSPLILSRSCQPCRSQLHPQGSPAHRLQRRSPSVHAHRDDLPALHLVVPSDSDGQVPPRTQGHSYVFRSHVSLSMRLISSSSQLWLRPGHRAPPCSSSRCPRVLALQVQERHRGRL